MEYADFKIPVRTLDGEDLGWLSQVDGPFMKIGRGWFRRDRWVPTEYIVSATAREVMVSFKSTDIARYIVDPQPAPQPVESARPEAA